MVDYVRVPLPRNKEDGTGQIVSYVNFPKRKNNPRHYDSNVRPVYMEKINAVKNNLPCPSSNTRPFVNITLGDANNAPKLKVLYDTGASISLISKSTFQWLKRNVPQFITTRKESISASNASGEDMDINYAVTIEFQVAGIKCKAPFFVSENANEDILGMNIISHYSLNVDPLSNRVCQISEEIDDLPHLEKGQWIAVTRQIEVLEPQTAHLIKFAIQNSETKEFLKGKHSFVANMDLMSITSHTDENGKFFCHIPNAKHEKVEFARGTKMGEVFPKNDYGRVDDEDAIAAVRTDAVERRRKHSAADIVAIKEALRTQIDKTVPKAEQPAYVEALFKLHDHFSADSLDLGFSDLIEHEIDLDDKDPVYLQQFRLVHDHLAFIKENVAGWLKAGIIKPSWSRYNAPLFSVPKKGNFGLRCILDYRH